LELGPPSSFGNDVLILRFGSGGKSEHGSGLTEGFELLRRRGELGRRVEADGDESVGRRRSWERRTGNVEGTG